MFIQAESHSDGIMTQEIMLDKEKKKKKHVYCKPLEVEFSRERGLLETSGGGGGGGGRVVFYQLGYI